MTTLIYTKLPFEQIQYIERPEFHKDEKKFKSRLVDSIKKHGIVDPLYAEFGNNYGRHIKIIVGNNRMAVAREIGIKKVKAIITNFKADQFPLKGKVLKTDKEIKNLFHLPHQVEVRRDAKGEVDQVNHPQFRGDIIDEYV